MESYRTELVLRQRTVAYLGQLTEAERLGVKQAARGERRPTFPSPGLFETATPPNPQWEEIEAKGIKVENELAFGGPWLALQLIHLLELDKFFRGGDAPGPGSGALIPDGIGIDHLPVMQPFQRAAYCRAFLLLDRFAGVTGGFVRPGE